MKTIKLLIYSTICLVFLLSCNSNNDSDNQQQVTVNKEVKNTVSKGTYFIGKNGKEIHLEDLQGKVTFINFWAKWCAPCIKEMPEIVEMTKSFSNNPNIQFLFVDIDEELTKSMTFMEKKDFNLPVYIPAPDMPASYVADVIPKTIILDKKGNIVATKVGMFNYNTDSFKRSLEKFSKE